MAVNKTINKRTNTHGAMRNCIEYVLRQDKTGELLTYVTGPYCHDEINYDLVYRTFLEEKKMWNKDSGRMYAHNVISWHKDEQITLEQAASLELVAKERDELQMRNQKMNEFILEFQERTHKVKMEKQKLFFENHEMQDEIRKLNDEIHCLTTELSETQKLNQSLQKNNDDLRNRNGLKSRSEQELLEEEIKDVRDQNSKLQDKVNKSSVEDVEEAQKKQKEAEKKARTIEYQFNKAQEEVKTVKKKTDCEIKRLKNEAKEKETFWMIVYMILVLLAVIKNTVFQKDLFACITVPLRFWYRYIEWLIHPSELNILGEREYFSAGWSWFLRIMAILIFLGLGISSEIFVLRKIEQYRKAWDKYSIWILLISVTSIAVTGDVVRKYIPINLILLLVILNIVIMEIRIYYHDTNELYQNAFMVIKNQI